MQITDTYRFNHPDFIIVGAAKSGTTSLHRYLSQHPDLFLPKIKETWFYHLVDNPNRAVLRDFPHLPTNLPAFLSLFEEARPDQLCGEVTPSYLHYYSRTIRNIQRLHPRWREVKIVMILREPIAKVISHYQYVRRLGYDPDNLNLYDALRREEKRRVCHDITPDVLYVENTRYPEAVKAYLDTFPRVKIFLYDDLKADEAAVMRELTAFIGAPPFDYPSQKVYNRSAPVRLPINRAAAAVIDRLEDASGLLPTRLRRSLTGLLTVKEEIDPRALRILRDAFREDVRRLGPLIGRDLDHWMAKYD